APSARIDYVAIVDAYQLRELLKLEGEVLIALAVWIGNTRLIDNLIITVS
ncbi:pantoate--beta-alanine ligase, partial [candidate division KSB1 bacterium]